MSVRVRFAPSLTGLLHIGNVRTALFNWLFAKKEKGKFIIRIEDTDVNRDNPKLLKNILEELKWLNIDWDEGPDISGPFAPYIQSQRLDIYKKYLDILFKKNKVYEKDGAIWLKTNGNNIKYVNDIIRGSIKTTVDKDFVIFRSNGTPVFHFVNVIDDIEMKITHIIRGEDHISNIGKHILLYNMFEHSIPYFAHLPLIMSSIKGEGKMSKRKNNGFIEYYRNKNFIPDAFINYLCLLGWSPSDNKEIIEIPNLIKEFSLLNVNKHSCSFDEKKLEFINGVYLRKCPINKIKEYIFNIIIKKQLLSYDDLNNIDENFLLNIIKISQEKSNNIDDLINMLIPFLKEEFLYDQEALLNFKKIENNKLIIKEIKNELSKILFISEDEIKNCFELISAKMNIPISKIMIIIRIAVSGRLFGPPILSILYILKKQRIINRISNFLNIIK